MKISVYLLDRFQIFFFTVHSFEQDMVAVFNLKNTVGNLSLIHI